MRGPTRLGIGVTCAAFCLVVASEAPGAAAAGAPAAQAGEPLPPDIHPRSRNRLSALALDASGEPVVGADAILRRGTVTNLRWDTDLPRPLLELAILITAREHDQQYEWSLHELEAMAVGLDPAIIDVVRHRRDVDRLAEREAAIIQAGREIFGRHHLSTDTYRRMVGLFGERTVVDLAGLMGQYAGTAARLTAVNQHMPPGWAALLPLPFTPPDDIDPQSRSRLPLVRGPAELTRARPSLYGRQLSPEGTGPVHIRRHMAGQASLEANVPRPILDLAQLVAARAYDAQYAWTLNELVALENGLDPAVIDVVRHGRPAGGLPDLEAALIAFGREVFDAHNVQPETYARMETLLGTATLVDLVDFMARHVADLTLLIAFDQHLPAGQAPLLPLP